MSLLAELRRRHVIRMAIAYAVVGWLLVEVASVVLPTFEAPGWVLKVVTFLIILGFPMAIAFAWVFEFTPEGLKRASANDQAAWDGNPAPRRARVAPEPFPESAAPDAGPKSIAVLPFVNMSADADNEYFSDGVTEEILNLLTKLPELKVSSRTSSFAFKGKDIDIPTVAARLKVKNVLEGSVRRAGDRVRITAQLIDTESDTHLWSDTYDRELEDIFKVQDDIAQNIVEALKVTLTPAQQQALETSRASSVDAYDYYLRGRSYYVRATYPTLTQAQEMFQRAIEVDRNYAPAYAWLANCHSWTYSSYDSDAAHLAQADALSKKAVELAPDLDQAFVARGYALSVNKQYAEAEQAFETALRLNPRSADAYYYYGAANYKQGNFERAAELWERAVEADPGDRRSWRVLPQVYRSLGRSEDSLRAYRESAELLQRSLGPNPNDTQDLLSLATARMALGQPELALSSTERVLQLAGDDANVLYNAACIFSLAGEKTKALDTLEKSYAAGLADPEWMDQDSDFDNIRSDPRFVSLLARMKVGR